MSYGMKSPMSIAGPSGQVGNKIPSGYKAGQLRQFTPEQMQLFQQLFSQVSPDSFTAKLAGGDQSAFDQMEAPALRQFGELQGNIASRFSGLGGQGSLSSRKSSGFQNEMNTRASNFAQDLQAQRLAYQRQAIQDLMGMSKDLLNQRPYQNIVTPKRQSQSSGIGGLLGAGLGGVGGFFAGGGSPYTALQGAQLGYGIGSGF